MSDNATIERWSMPSRPITEAVPTSWLAGGFAAGYLLAWEVTSRCAFATDVHYRSGRS